MSLEDVKKTILYLDNHSDNQLKKNPCVGDRFLLLKNGIKILKIIINKFPIEKIIVTQRA